MSKLLDQGFRIIYTRIVGQEPSQFSSELSKNFLMAAGSTGIATIITFGINILAARAMGPIEFGKWNLIGSWAEFLVIIPLFGLTTALPRYLGASDEKLKATIIGSGFRIVLISSVISLPIFWFIQQRFQIIPDAGLVGATFGYGIILAFFYLVQSFFQGLKEFKKLSILWLVSAFGFVAIVLVYLFILGNHSYFSLYWSNVVRLLFVVVIGLVLFGPYIIKYSREQSRELLHFGSFSMLSVVAGFFSLGAIDIILINHYLGPVEVGIYSAYYVTFSAFVGKILSSFLQVFLPMAAGHNNHKQLLQSILKFAWKGGLFLYASLIVLIRILFYVYGKGFTFDWNIALVLALNITLYVLVMVIGYLITSKGIEGARFGFITSLIAAITNVSFDILLIPKFGLIGSVYASLAMIIALGLAQFLILKFYYFKEQNLLNGLDS